MTYLTKLTDFGMTRAIDAASLTRSSSIKGTPGFMPPEALRYPPQYDEKLNVFSYGNLIIMTITHEWPTPVIPRPSKTEGQEMQDAVVYSQSRARRGSCLLKHRINSKEVAKAVFLKSSPYRIVLFQRDGYSCP